ncbi:tetraacyldisaccharide 4'-kinase [Flagellimonas marina]|uniref:Tetraacyldisaccharide 4'-kinase n=1 Tax=Flagellimonas marina TaxID=1775168 RepID=A0ABV8PQH8_9FLAO
MLQLLRKIAFPFSLVYGLVVHLRNFLYDTGVFKSHTYNTPTLCVGNLSVGGTGKTPMIEFLVRMFKGHTIAVLSRGYKRQSKGFLWADANSSVLDLGDEPYQLHQKFPEITVAVDADRRNGITQLENKVKPELILLDDAFQHRRVKPNFSILLTSYGNLYVDDWYLPTGDLRDSKREAKRADCIIVTKCPKNLSQSEKNRIQHKLKPLPHQKVLFATLEYSTILKGEVENLSLPDIKKKKVTLVTGIAQPEPLVQYLQSEGVLFEHYKFGDHHHFSESDIQKFRDHALILTTEKDYVRLQGRVKNLFYVEVAHSFGTEDHLFLEETLKSLI